MELEDATSAVGSQLVQNQQSLWYTPNGKAVIWQTQSDSLSSLTPSYLPLECESTGNNLRTSPVHDELPLASPPITVSYFLMVRKDSSSELRHSTLYLKHLSGPQCQSWCPRTHCRSNTWQPISHQMNQSPIPFLALLHDDVIASMLGSTMI